jgi:hypothetical protein
MLEDSSISKIPVLAALPPHIREILIQLFLVLSIEGVL